ncbi:MAG: aldehyde dehydrogenase family protein [Phycisphaerales bacterium]
MDRLSAMQGSSEPWPLKERLKWLRRFRIAVASNAEFLCDRVHEDVHKPRWEALTGDVMPLLAACRWLEKRAQGLLRERRLTGSPWWQWGTSVRERRVPVGTVGIIATWNYPIQLLGIQLAEALVAGNCVVVKPSEHSPRSQGTLLRMAARAGLPDGRLRWLEATREAGVKMLEQEDLDHVVFTGSTAVGRLVAAWGAERLVPTTLELSGRDSAIVLADADIRVAASSIWHSFAMNGGQTCLAPRRVLVDERVYAEFVRALGLHAAGAKPVRLITSASVSRCAVLAAAAVEAGGRPISGVLEAPSGDTMRPVVIVDCPRDTELVAGDHFGPVLAVLPAAGLEDAISIHTRCEQHLATSMYTADEARARAVAERFGVTIVSINDAVLPASHPAASVGGIGPSGWGVSRGAGGLLALTRPIYVTRTSRWLRVPLGDPGPDRLAVLHRVLRWVFGGRRAERVDFDAGVQHPAKGGVGAASVSQLPQPLGTTARQPPQN